jgi:1,6-anhydro-N-acetylmuramate kinase
MKEVTRRHLLGGARGETAGVAFDAADEAEPDCAIDKRMDAADSAAVADALADAVAAAVAGKVNDVRLCCGGGVPNSGMSRGLALALAPEAAVAAVAALASSYSVGDGI